MSHDHRLLLRCPNVGLEVLMFMTVWAWFYARLAFPYGSADVHGLGAT